MENKIEIFSSAEFGTVRTLKIDDVVWFVGKDVAEALGYARPTKAIADHIDDEDKDEIPIQDTIGRMQKTPVINESGLYSLVLSSKLPTAKKFKHWVTSEVLPTVRKYGMYAVDEVLNNPDMLIAALTELKEERKKIKALSETVAVQQQQIIEMKPKASYYDIILNCPDLLSTSVIAKDYGKSAKWLNDYLHSKGVQYKQGGKIWLLYQKYAQLGYTSTKTHNHSDNKGNVHTSVHTYWTQKGRLFIYDLLKSDNILPIVERG